MADTLYSRPTAVARIQPLNSREELRRQWPEARQQLPMAVIDWLQCSGQWRDEGQPQRHTGFGAERLGWAWLKDRTPGRSYIQQPETLRWLEVFQSWPEVPRRQSRKKRPDGRRWYSMFPDWSHFSRSNHRYRHCSHISWAPKRSRTGSTTHRLMSPGWRLCHWDTGRSRSGWGHRYGTPGIGPLCPHNSRVGAVAHSQSWCAAPGHK